MRQDEEKLSGADAAVGEDGEGEGESEGESEGEELLLILMLLLASRVVGIVTDGVVVVVVAVIE